MCLICVEYYFKRMTKEELKNALPEMVMFAKNEKDSNHFKKLQSLDSLEEIEKEVKLFVSQNPERANAKNEYKTSFKNR